MNARLTEPKLCTVDGCTNHMSAKGLCALHYRRAWAEGRYRKRHLPILCDYPACFDLATVRGMCNLHYRRVTQQHRLRTEPELRAYRHMYFRKWVLSNPERQREHVDMTKRVRRWAHWLATSCMGTSKKRGITCDFDGDYLLTMFEQQKGLCYWLGIPMVPSIENRSPLRPSVDRLVAEKGYTRGNVVLATQFANLGRNSCSADAFATFIGHLKATMPR